jgi:dynein heavy chain
MKAISDKTFRRLKDYVENPKFIPEAVKEGSLAAMSICVWIRAVYHFCVVYREYFPKQQRVIEAKKILDEVDFEFFMSVLIRKEIRKRSSQHFK